MDAICKKPRAHGRAGRSACGRARMTAAVLSVSGARKAFGGLVAVNDVSFEVQDGELFGLIGPNGSGKTTMLNLISGALKPDAGEIVLVRHADLRTAGAQDRAAGRRAHVPARAHAAGDGCGAKRDRRRGVRPSAALGRAGARRCARVAGAGRPARPRACAGRRHDLYRPEARRAGARARVQSARAAARRMAGRPQSERTAISASS